MSNVRSKKTLLQLAHDLESSITSGHLSPGERLPGEQEFCRRYQASRPAVREALQSLKARGLIISRRGSGSYVASPCGAGSSLQDSMALYSALQREGTAFLELLDLRLLVECFCITPLAEPGKLPARRHLRKHLEAMETAGENLEAFGRADIHFHLAIVEQSGHQLFGNIMRGLLPGLGIRFARETYVSLDLMETNLREHRAICRALDEGQGTLARTRLRRHLLSSRRRLEHLLLTPDLSNALKQG